MARNLHQTPEVSVLVPVMNEQGNIRPLIDEIASVYNGRAFEIIYVNDASNDGTPSRLDRRTKKTFRNCALSIIKIDQVNLRRFAPRYWHRARPLIAVLDGMARIFQLICQPLKRRCWMRVRHWAWQAVFGLPAKIALCVAMHQRLRAGCAAAC